MSESPLTNGVNGRGSDGRFAKGNAGGPGNPHAAQVAGLRSALLNAITPEKMTAVVEKLIVEALEGNVQAAKEVLERALGKPIEMDLLERLERLEELLAKENRWG
jgi:uncharacterized protein YjcR